MKILQPCVPTSLKQEDLEGILHKITPRQVFSDVRFGIRFHEGLRTNNPDFRGREFYEKLCSSFDYLREIFWKHLTPFQFHVLLGGYVVEQSHQRGLIEPLKRYFYFRKIAGVQ